MMKNNKELEQSETLAVGAFSRSTMKTKQFNSRYLDFFKVNLFIMFQTMKEYKANLYSVFLIQIVFISISYFTSFIIASNFGQVIGWNFLDFLVYQVLIRIIYQFSGIFLWGKSISHSIINAQFNNHLVMPLNIKLKYYFNNLSSSGYIYILFSLCELLILLIFFYQREINYLILLTTLLFLIVYHFLIHQSLETMGFHYKKLDHQLLRLYYPLTNILSSYPINYFQFFSFRNLLIFIPHSILVFFIFPSSITISLFTFYVILIVVSFLLVLILIINWKIGLKKYEAYG